MSNIPYIVISTAMTLDGYIDDASDKRLLISNEKDLERVNALRDTCEAILVGANTIRNDDPKLLAKSGKKLIKVTITSSGNIDTNSQFFTTGDSDKLVYTNLSNAEILNKKLSNVATVVGIESGNINVHVILEDLHKRGVKRLIVEGGSTILTQFLKEGLVNELHIAIAGFFVGQKGAPRFVKHETFPWNENNRLHLESVKKLDEIAVLVYKV